MNASTLNRIWDFGISFSSILLSLILLLWYERWKAGKSARTIISFIAEFNHFKSYDYNLSDNDEMDKIIKELLERSLIRLREGIKNVYDKIIIIPFVPSNIIIELRKIEAHVDQYFMHIPDDDLGTHEHFHICEIRKHINRLRL